MIDSCEQEGRHETWLSRLDCINSSEPTDFHRQVFIPFSISDIAETA